MIINQVKCLNPLFFCIHPHANWFKQTGINLWNYEVPRYSMNYCKHWLTLLFYIDEFVFQRAHNNIMDVFRVGWCWKTFITCWWYSWSSDDWAPLNNSYSRVHCWRKLRLSALSVPCSAVGKINKFMAIIWNDYEIFDSSLIGEHTL